MDSSFPSSFLPPLKEEETLPISSSTTSSTSKNYFKEKVIPFELLEKIIKNLSHIEQVALAKTNANLFQHVKIIALSEFKKAWKKELLKEPSPVEEDLTISELHLLSEIKDPKFDSWVLHWVNSKNIRSLQQTRELFKNFKKCLKDKELVVSILEKSGVFNVPPTLLGAIRDKYPEEYYKRAVKTIQCQSCLFSNLPDILKEDKNLILKVFKKSENLKATFESLIPRFKNDKEIAIALVLEDRRAIDFLPPDLQKDRDVLFARDLQYISDINSWGEKILYGKPPIPASKEIDDLNSLF